MALELDAKNAAATGDAASGVTGKAKAKENKSNNNNTVTTAGEKNLVNGSSSNASKKKGGKKNRNKSPPQEAVATETDAALSNGHAGKAAAVNGGDAADANANVVADKELPTAAGAAEGEEGTKEAVADGDEASGEDVDLDALHDVGITVNISSPGADVLSVQLSSMELVQEIHQLLMDREETCHRTCFSLQLDNVTLDNFAELKTIEHLDQGSTIRVVEEPYTMREARIHVRHVRDLLKNLDPADAYNGIDCISLTYLKTITQGDLLDKKRTRPDSVDCTPPEYVTPGVREPPLLPLHPNVKNAKGPQALKVLTTSAWNPPPGPRKLHGDLMYLYVVTMEDKRFHISACSKGFYINQSTDDCFNPKPDNPSHLSHSLIDLLSHISPSFRRAFQAIQKRRTMRHAFERVATPYQVYQWSAPQLEHTVDAIRAEDAFSSKLGYEEHIPGQTRDWNEELQTTRELPRKTLPERLLRERAIFKVHGDFVTAATRGAMAVIDGNVLAINPGEDAKMQMFIWNNIFFSLGFDVRDHYKELGGDHAAFVAPRYDLHGVRVYNAVDVEGLYTLGTVVIDYRGYRVTAQSIIPGILEREQEQSVVYGSIDFGKTVLSHPKYLELLRLAGKHLKILPHSVLNERDEAVELCSSVECKGIIGNDGRHYILDLLRTFPPDVNFLKLQDVQLSKELTEMGFPIEHRHKLCCLRQELLEAFIEDRYVTFIRIAAVHLQSLNAKKQAAATAEKELPAIAEKQQEEQAEKPEEKPNDEAKTTAEEKPAESSPSATETKSAEAMVNAIREAQSNVAISNEVQAAEVVKRACSAVGSLKEKEFDFRFNPDVFSPGIRHVDGPEGGSQSLAKQKKLVQDAAEFLVLKQIPAFIKEHMAHSSPPIDGQSLTDSLHSHGINIRYLGKVIKMLGQMPRMDYLHRIAIMELIVRATKHIYYTYMQSTEPLHLSAAISHFLNCLVTTGPVNPAVSSEEAHKKQTRSNGGKHNKHNKSAKTSKPQQAAATQQNGGGNSAAAGGSANGSNGSSSSSYDWTLVTPRSLWQQIRKEAKAYWNWELDCDSIEAAVSKYGLQRISLLRAFCLKVGIQVLLRDYNFESKHKPTFSDDDIVNVFPVVKHISPRATDAYNFYTTGQTKIQQGLLKEGYELISEALNLLNNVFGAMHQENGSCLRMLARLSYLLGDAQDALAIQQRAVIMSERVNGIDNPSTILEYAHLSLYSFANGHVGMSLKLLYRARYLLVLICGEDHPEVALIDSNISLILHALGEYELSLRFIEHALKLNLKYFGNKAMHVAVSYHLMARTQSCMGDFRSALNNEKETYSIYKSQLGEKHDKTRESAECLRLLTHEAVALQRKMNDIYTNGKLTSDLPPIHITPPSMGSVLEMLNTINGILFVHISQKDIVKVRTEIEKHLKTNTEENEITDALKTIVASANNNENLSETEQPKEDSTAAGEPVKPTQLTNGGDASTTVSS
ncbi:protein clueless [Drosophila sulfurigaster albostrigata]|uniref:protein clueless n=1 Tax=Drosophila sulfurigaster albostrigata TaxID=89887 RepID=UPI002D21BA76|nr:protein clueless [Drosophila sulfurigaster albostrigata]